MQLPVNKNSKKIILVQIDPKYLLQSDRDKHYRENERKILMDYSAMVKALQNGQKATRSTWKEGMYVWFSMNIVLHSHPYWPDQQKIWDNNGFPYICEKDDATSDDWMLISA